MREGHGGTMLHRPYLNARAVAGFSHASRTEQRRRQRGGEAASVRACGRAEGADRRGGTRQESYGERSGDIVVLLPANTRTRVEPDPHSGSASLSQWLHPHRPSLIFKLSLSPDPSTGASLVQVKVLRACAGGGRMQEGEMCVCACVRAHACMCITACVHLRVHTYTTQNT